MSSGREISSFITGMINGRPMLPRGFQLPKIMTARAKKPKPATSPLAEQLAVVRA